MICACIPQLLKHRSMLILCDRDLEGGWRRISQVMLLCCAAFQDRLVVLSLLRRFSYLRNDMVTCNDTEEAKSNTYIAAFASRSL